MAVKSELSEQKLGYIREFVNDKDPKEEYKLIQSIGTGTYGEVYKALRLRTKELAAVKIIKIDAKDDVRAILQEIQTLRDCKHSNIVQFFGSYFRNNKLWICMEFCGGFSMQDIYTNIRRPIDENCIAFVTRETLRGIEYMHKAGKIHRDIKGANILLTNDGDVKIADFGVAAQITQTIQRRNSFIGTPYWMAPEVAAVERKGGYDEKCDIWALGITAMEYAELQPPLFDLHPMRALRILGMRSYKPPTLRNKAVWSSKFHSFLKSALTKSEKKRPTAQALLRHEFVTQSHLSRLLTIKLLELNRNPDRLVASGGSSVAKPNAIGAAPLATPQSSSSALPNRPDALLLDTTTSTPTASSEDNKSSKSSDSNKKCKVSASAKERPQPPEKMHTPWTGRAVPEESTPVSSSANTPVNSPVQPGPKPWVPAERITSTRQATNQLNGVASNMHSGSAMQPCPPKALLEEIRIMDELPTPLPAYVSAAPTASPAPKPSGECGQLLSSGKSPKVAVATNICKPPPAPGPHVPVEALVQQRRVASSASPVAPTRIALSDSSTVASSASGSSCSSNSSSSSSASTSPRSSCSSLILESAAAAASAAASSAPLQPAPSSGLANGHELIEELDASSLVNGNVSTQNAMMDSACSMTQSVAAPEYLTVFEPVVLQDSLEAKFLPIDGEAILLASNRSKPCTEASAHQLNADLVTPSLPNSTPIAEHSSPSTIATNMRHSPTSVESDNNESESGSDEVSSYEEDGDEDEEEDDDALETDRLSDDATSRGTVTTIDSVTSNSTNPNLSTESIPHMLSTECDQDIDVVTAASIDLTPNNTSRSTHQHPARLEKDAPLSAPQASTEHADDWDLEIADEELLAADGLLNLNRSRPDSMSDRISEFGFRIHGSEGEEDEEDDDEVDDYEFPEVNQQNGVSIPNNIPRLEVQLNATCTSIPGSVTPTEPLIQSDAAKPAVTGTKVGGTDQSTETKLHTDSSVNMSREDNSPSEHVSAKLRDKTDALSKAQTDQLHEFYPDKSGEELMSLLRQLKFAQKFAWLSGSTVLPTTLSALANLQSTKISLNGTSEPPRPRSEEVELQRKPVVPQVVEHTFDSPAFQHTNSMTDRTQSDPQLISPEEAPISVLSDTKLPPMADEVSNANAKINEINQPEEIVVSATVEESTEQMNTISPLLLQVQPPSCTNGFHLDDVSPIDSDRSVQASPVCTDAVNLQKPTIGVPSESLDESGIQLLASPTDQSPEMAYSTERQAATVRLSDIMGERVSELEEIESSDDSKLPVAETKPTDTPVQHAAETAILGACPEVELSIADAILENSLSSSKDLKIRSMETTVKHSLARESHTGSLQLLPYESHESMAVADPEDVQQDTPLASPEVENSEQVDQQKSKKENELPVTRVQSSNSATECRTSFSRTYPPRPDTNGVHSGSTNALMSSSQVNAYPLSRAAQLRENDGSQKYSGSSGSRSSRFSMIELSHMDERPLYASCTALPHTPQVHMGACFSLVFEGCPLKINSTATWINPMNNGQVILFGTNDGIYYLNLKELADSSLELLCHPSSDQLFPRRCLWLSVVRDTMMSLSGRHPQLYSHNLISLMKLKSQGQLMNGNTSKLGKLSKFFPKRFSPSKKIPETKGCRRVSLTRSPFNGAKYLCAAIGNEILVMEWFNPISSFIEIKRIFVPDMPSPLLTFDLFIDKERPLPLVCLGVYRHHSRRGRENQRYRLHLIDLNAYAPVSPTPGLLLSPGFDQSIRPDKVNGESMANHQYPPVSATRKTSTGEIRKLGQKADCDRRNALFLAEDMLPVVEAVQLEHNTILVCLQDCAKVIGLNGRIKSSRHRATTLDFNGNMAESIVCLRDSILVFHPNGLLGKSFTGELTQEIHDDKHIYRLLGCDRNIIVESRPADDPMSNSNVYILAGHTDSHAQ